MRELKLEEVRKLLEASGREAQRSGKPSTTAIVDFGGHLRGLERPEGGRIANVDIAIKKAWTAIAFKRPTAMVRAVMMPDAMGYGL
ncbi:MAG: GlcG/HbpS family heme-binding protein, partial [Candidatus Binataceae bacterium]